MDEFIKLLKTTEISYTRDIQGFSPQIHSDGDCDGDSDGDCVTSNCDGGWGACECNCDCPDK